MASVPEQRNKQGTWLQAFSGFGWSLLIYLTLRWLLLEAFVIPSGSMLPTLLIHDYILVNKVVYGLRLPFSKTWLVHFHAPQRGEIVVFRSIEDRDHYLIKRVVAVEGDELQYTPQGQLLVNKKPVPTEPLSADQLPYGWPEGEAFREASLQQYDLIAEQVPGHRYSTWVRRNQNHMNFGPEVVPKGYLFVMGDNRDHSQDSRYWGYLPVENILGRASLVWLSCSDEDGDARGLCDPSHIRLDRLFKWIR